MTVEIDRDNVDEVDKFFDALKKRFYSELAANTPFAPDLGDIVDYLEDARAHMECSGCDEPLEQVTWADCPNRQKFERGR